MNKMILSPQENIYWEKVFNTEFIVEAGCYKTCNSFCCRWDSPDMAFRIIPKGGTLFYLPKEYAYISQYGKVTENNPFIMKAKLFDKEIYLYYKHCNDDNNCNVKFSRSLYCKLYPFLPVFDINGTLTDLKYISVYDVTADIIGQKTPCYVIDLKEKYLKYWQENPEKISLLKEPYTLFYLMAGNILHDNYVNTLTDNKELMSLTGSIFWKKWEKLYLAGKLVNKIQLEKSIETLYTAMFQKYHFIYEE
mgnify:CR=1 FL=1